ncbi:MAG: hypothetical protein JJ975_00770 [Bacteroidia bacterium]|nr:hypothetical protein [Bacteroidia bacterium]
MKTIVQTPTPDLEASLSFYSDLGFKPITNSNPHLLTDGKVLMEVNPDRFARAGIKMFSDDWGDTVDKLKELTAVTKTSGGYILSDFSGAWIYLMNSEGPAHEVTEVSYSALGNYAGISLESTDIQKSLNLFDILGFSNIVMGSVEQGFVVTSNEEGTVLSLMKPGACPHLFFNPSLSYFNGTKNVEIIDNLRQLNIPITEEITHFNPNGDVDNIIVRDPGGFGFFVFSD